MNNKCLPFNSVCDPRAVAIWTLINIEHWTPLLYVSLHCIGYWFSSIPHTQSSAIYTIMNCIFILLACLVSGIVAVSEKLAGGAALEDVVPMQKVKRPKLKEPYQFPEVTHKVYLDVGEPLYKTIRVHFYPDGNMFMSLSSVCYLTLLNWTIVIEDDEPIKGRIVIGLFGKVVSLLVCVKNWIELLHPT